MEISKQYILVKRIKIEKEEKKDEGRARERIKGRDTRNTSSTNPTDSRALRMEFEIKLDRNTYYFNSVKLDFKLD